MRRTQLVSILLAAALILSMTACGQAVSVPVTAAPTVSRAPEDLLPVNISSDEPLSDSAAESDTTASELESSIDSSVLPAEGVQPLFEADAIDSQLQSIAYLDSTGTWVTVPYGTELRNAPELLKSLRGEACDAPGTADVGYSFILTIDAETCRLELSTDGENYYACLDDQYYLLRMDATGYPGLYTALAGADAENPALPGTSDSANPIALGDMTFDSVYTAYMWILRSLWQEDFGLAEEIQYIAIDLSDAPGELGGTETHALAMDVFDELSGGQGSAALLELSYDELDLLGYLTGDDDDKWFENGVLLSITAVGTQSDDKICFDARLWRSPLGAAGYMDCTLTRNEDGSWGGFACTYYVA